MHQFEDCPFCGANPGNDPVALTQINEYEWAVTHFCFIDYTKNSELRCAIHCYGRTPEEAVERWNQRIVNERKYKNA